MRCSSQLVGISSPKWEECRRFLPASRKQSDYLLKFQPVFLHQIEWVHHCVGGAGQNNAAVIYRYRSEHVHKALLVFLPTAAACVSFWVTHFDAALSTSAERPERWGGVWARWNVTSSTKSVYQGQSKLRREPIQERSPTTGLTFSSLLIHGQVGPGWVSISGFSCLSFMFIVSSSSTDSFYLLHQAPMKICLCRLKVLLIWVLISFPVDA